MQTSTFLLVFTGDFHHFIANPENRLIRSQNPRKYGFFSSEILTPFLEIGDGNVLGEILQQDFAG